MNQVQKITPFLWFNNNAEEAMEFYKSVFNDAEITHVMRNGKGSPAGPEDSILTATFRLAGQEFMALNGGPMFTFTEAVSFFVKCKDQQEVDYYWEKLTADGGQESMCGWLKDKFGLSWQIVPDALMQLMHGGTPEQSRRVMQAMMQMRKIEVPALQKAFDGE